MLLLQTSRAVTARLKRESGREISRDVETAARSPLQPRGGKLGHQAPAIQRRDVGMSCTEEGFDFPAVWFSDLLGSRRRVGKSLEKRLTRVGKALGDISRHGYGALKKQANWLCLFWRKDDGRRRDTTDIDSLCKPAGRSRVKEEHQGLVAAPIETGASCISLHVN